jgi:hyperosmotically inducible protein
MALVLRLVLLIAIVAGLVSLLRNQNLGRGAREAQRDLASAVRDAKETASSLDASEISDELKGAGTAVRRKVSDTGRQVAEAAADGRTTAAIKVKLARDPELSALGISVDTTGGRVTLAGRVSSRDHVARAVKLAYQEDGVREVVSTLQVRFPRAAAGQ